MYIICMPVIMTINSVKFCVYFDDHGKAHCHVLKNGCEAKILIESGTCIEVSGFTKKDVNELEKLVKKNANRLLKAWEEFNE
jgi:hypothetical protein